MRCHVVVWGLALSLIAGRQMPAAEDLAALEEQAMRSAVARIAPSVVKIETFGGLEAVGKVIVGTGPTTGLAVSEDGFVVSSAFNFVQKPQSILVTLPSGKRAAADIVARDRSRMLVLLKVHTPEKFAVPVAVPRTEMATGQWTIAVGRTYDQEPNPSVGVMSATDRIWGKAIQTDAKISPNNYGGPLVDIRGRVLGVLVPLSPQGQGEIAGAEWYDSGIGFAVPLADILPRLEALKKGQDLHAGLLGVTLKGNDQFAGPVELAAVHPKSPAYDAGLKVGDKIVEAEGAAVPHQAKLKHVLGRFYAGDTVRLVALRGNERIAASVKLAEKLDPYEHPFLGLLPTRDTAGAGVLVRFVYPGSPAAEAGLRAGDRVTKFDDKPVTDAAMLRDAVANADRAKGVALQFERSGAGQTATVTLKTSKLPTDVPAELPPPRESPGAPPADRPPTGVVEIKVPEVKNACYAFIPEDYHPGASMGLLVDLHAPNEVDREKQVARWKTLCQDRRLILLLPRSADAARWQPTEVEFVRKTMDDILGRYRIDPTRVVVHGDQGGGSMAGLVALGNREVVRGLSTTDAPPTAKAADSDPIQRLAIYTTTAKESSVNDRVEAAIKRLREAKFPVTAKHLGDKPRSLTADELNEFGRWIDTLDRI